MRMRRISRGFGIICSGSWKASLGGFRVCLTQTEILDRAEREEIMRASNYVAVRFFTVLYCIDKRDSYGVGHFVIPLDMFHFAIFEGKHGVSLCFKGALSTKYASRVWR